MRGMTVCLAGLLLPFSFAPASAAPPATVPAGSMDVTPAGSRSVISGPVLQLIGSTPPPTAPVPPAPAAATAAAPTTAPSTQPVDAQLVERLIRQLSDDDFQVREDAQDQLVRLEGAAEPALQQLAATTSDAEAASRADRALRQIKENRLIGPTLITLHFKNAPAKKVFQELVNQTGFKLSTMPANLFDQNNIPPVTIDLERQPFWEAVRQFANATGVSPQIYYGGRGTTMQFCMNGQNLFIGPSAIHGPVALIAQQVSRSESVQLIQAGGGSTSRNLSVSFMAMFEPKLRRAGVASSQNMFVNVREATSDKGDSLLVNGNQESQVGGGGNGGYVNFGFSLKCPDTLGGRIKKLRGELRYSAPVRTESLEVPEVASAKNVSKVMGGRKYEIISVGEKNQQWTVEIRVYRNGVNDQDWQQVVQGLYQGATPQLLDAEGRELAFQGCNINQNNSDSASGSCTFAPWIQENPGQQIKPAKLIWIVPVESRPVVMPFEFKDIPLP